MDMSFVVLTKTLKTESYSGLGLDRFLQVFDMLGVNDVDGDVIVCADNGVSFYVAEICDYYIMRLLFGYKTSHFSMLLRGGSFNISYLSKNEASKYKAEIDELFSNYSPDKATDLIDRLRDRYTEIFDYMKDSCVNTERISNVKRSLAR